MGKCLSTFCGGVRRNFSNIFQWNLALLMILGNKCVIKIREEVEWIFLGQKYSFNIPRQQIHNENPPIDIDFTLTKENSVKKTQI